MGHEEREGGVLKVGKKRCGLCMVDIKSINSTTSCLWMMHTLKFVWKGLKIWDPTLGQNVKRTLWI